MIPTGPGEARRLERPGLTLLDARWLPDGKRVVARARTQDGAPRIHVLDLEGNMVRPVTPDGLDVGVSGWTVSPDGTMIAMSSDRRSRTARLAGGAARHVPGAAADWRVVGWIERGLLVSSDPAAGGSVSLIDPSTGRRERWADIQPQDPAGIMSLDLDSLVTTPDGRGYGYSWHRAMSDLYLVEGWR